MKYEELLKCHGRKFKATIYDTECEGKITVEEDRIFLCQNLEKGTDCVDKQGYECSWVYFYEDGFVSLCVDDFQLIVEEPKTNNMKKPLLKDYETVCDYSKALELYIESLEKEEDLSVDVSKFEEFYADNTLLIACRSMGEYENKAFFLREYLFDWELKRDSRGVLLLIPTKKK